MTLLDTADAARSFPGFAPNGDAQSGRTLRQRTARPLSEERLTRMSNSTGKRAYAPAQVTASLSALDFAAAHEAFGAALFKIEQASGDEAAVDAAADVAAYCADRLLGVPTIDPAQIAAKVDAYNWLHPTGAGPLHDAQSQRRIASSDNEAAKGLLAIYLDLVTAAQAGPAPTDRAEWNRVVGAYEDALAAKKAAEHAEDAVPEDAADALVEEAEASAEAARDAADRAMEAVLALRAPDAASMAEKARLILAHRHMEEAETTNPGFLSNFKAEGWEEETLGNLYQDALALAGTTGPLVTVGTDTFSASEWLETMEAVTGCVLSWVYADKQAGFTGGDEAGARLAWEALPYWHQSEVRVLLARRLGDQMREAQTPPDSYPGWSTAHTDPAMVLLFAEMTANKIGEGDTEADRERRMVLRRQFRTSARDAAGLVAPSDFDPAAFIMQAEAAGLHLVVKGEMGVPQIMQPRNAPMPAGGEEIVRMFCSLSEDQLDVLGDCLASRAGSA